MTDFAFTLAAGMFLGAACGLLLASILIALIEAAGRAAEDLEEDR